MGQRKHPQQLATAEGDSLNTLNVVGVLNSISLTLKQRVGGSSPPRLTTLT
jgi:hypothetical protein